LYRDTDCTFEAYAKRACGIGRSFAYRTIAYYQHYVLIFRLERRHPIVAKLATPTEASLRPLTTVPEDRREAVLDHLFSHLQPRVGQRSVKVTSTAVKKAIAAVVGQVATTKSAGLPAAQEMVAKQIAALLERFPAKVRATIAKRGAALSKKAQPDIIAPITEAA